jgi:hypothetical protein
MIPTLVILTILASGIGLTLAVARNVSHSRGVLAQDFGALSESVRAALSGNDAVRVAELRERDSFALELSFPSSRHHSTLLLRPADGGALQVDLKVPTRHHVPTKLSLRAIATTRSIHLADQRIEQDVVDLPHAEMDLNYWGHSITAGLFDLLRALFPDLLKHLQREVELHQARVEAFSLTSGALELRAVYPASAIAHLEPLVARLVALGAHAHLDDSTPGAFWDHLHSASPPESAARQGAISSLMRHAPDSPEAHGLHARVLAQGDLAALRTLYATSPHAFFSRMNRARLHHFVGRQLDDGHFKHGAVPEAAWNMLDADSLRSRELPSRLRLDLYARLLATHPERTRELTDALYEQLDADARAQLFTLASSSELRHVLPAVVAAARAHEPAHATASPDLALAYARAISACVTSGEVSWDDAFEGALARFTLLDEPTARIAADLLAEHGGAGALQLLASLQPQRHAPASFTHALLALKRRHVGDARLTGAMTLSESPDDALRGALSANADAGALTQLDDEDAP